MNTPTSTTGALIDKDSGSTNSAVIIESSKGAYISQFGGGIGGDVEIRSALMASCVYIQDMGGKFCLGMNGSYLAYSNTFAGSCAFIDVTQFNSDLTLLNRLIVNTTTTNTSTVSFNGLNTTDGTLLLSTAKGTNICRFHSGTLANIELRSGNATGSFFIQDHAGPLIIGTLTAQATFQNTIGGNTALKNNLRVLGTGTIDGNLVVTGVILSSSDSRIKEDVQPINPELCVEIVKSIEPKSYKRTNQINNTQREIGFIAQDL